MQKKNNGKFRLRIEDTDKSRNTEESIQTITKSVKWLGLQIDDDIVYQSKNQKEHVQIAESLLARGLAYKCFHDKEYIKQFSNSKKNFLVSGEKNKIKFHQTKIFVFGLSLL